ncbi:MAG: ABC transporter permease [Proteobacteria bacterium]|nr:ABC transporter permease subunit [Desulfobacula sp.]MBU3954420.1 ABC transporter permease [Pseudomonadota bacterium]MBU4129866.1 ABC transporter permease [Pseudomonadota bacterium]
MSFYLSHLKKIFQDQKIALTILVLFCFLFEWAFAWVFFESDIKKNLVSLIRMLPPGVSAFMGVQGGISQFAVQMLAFGYVHPIILISLSFLQISIPARYISGEVELKTFDLLLTKPVKRVIIPLSIFTFLVICLALEFAAMLMGTLAGDIGFDLKVDMLEYAGVAAVGFFFFLSMGAAATAISSFASEKGKSVAMAMGLFVCLYFFDTIVRLSKSLQFLEPYSYFHLYQPGKLILGEVGAGTCILISLGITAVFFCVSLVQFNRRDL